MNYFGITAGDPCGVGPEVVLKALRRRPELIGRCVVFGSAPMLDWYRGRLGIETPLHLIDNAAQVQAGCINVVDPYPVPFEEITIGQVSPVGGRCAFLAVRTAIDWALARRIGCVVTAPLNKEAMRKAGYQYAGHTEIFGEFTHGESYAMLLWSESLKVIHATTHVSMREACDLVTGQREYDVIHLAHDTLRKAGYEKPRIAVAGLNAHAGEHGLFGREEIEQIAPAIERCRAEGLEVSGPLPPDTVFLRAHKGEFDLVVAQYHDQGHIPLNRLAFDAGVNVTVGLDVVRTSVDHGTAFDIAGRLIAREDSMLAAIDLGEKLAQ